MRKSYVTRQQARAKVQAREAFKTSNGHLFGRWETPSLYVVYSYGDHWPLFLWDGTEWFENEDRTSITTTHHRGYTHPHCETAKVSRTWLRTIIMNRTSKQAA